MSSAGSLSVIRCLLYENEIENCLRKTAHEEKNRANGFKCKKALFPKNKDATKEKGGRKTHRTTWKIWNFAEMWDSWSAKCWVRI